MARIDRYLFHLKKGTLNEYYESRRHPCAKLSKYTKGKTREGGQMRKIGRWKRV